MRGKRIIYRAVPASKSDPTHACGCTPQYIDKKQPNPKITNRHKGIMTKVSCNRTTTATSTYQSHLVKHTDFIPSAGSVALVSVVVVHRTHVAYPGLPHGRSSRWTHGPWRRNPCRCGARHVRRMRRLNRFAIVHLRHSTYTPAAQPRILITVSPTIHCPLNQTALSAQGWVELRQCPADSITFRLVLQPIASVLVLRAACSWVDAVLSFKVA